MQGTVVNNHFVAMVKLQFDLILKSFIIFFFQKDCGWQITSQTQGIFPNRMLESVTICHTCLLKYVVSTLSQTSFLQM